MGSETPNFKGKVMAEMPETETPETPAVPIPKYDQVSSRIKEIMARDEKDPLRARFVAILLVCHDENLCELIRSAYADIVETLDHSPWMAGRPLDVLVQDWGTYRCEPIEEE